MCIMRLNSACGPVLGSWPSGPWLLHENMAATYYANEAVTNVLHGASNLASNNLTNYFPVISILPAIKSLGNSLLRL
jgi:hypothetical protein